MSVISMSTYMNVGAVPVSNYHSSVLAVNPRHIGQQVLPQTKCVVTIGPKCNQPEQLHALIEAGATGFRFNMSHVHDETQLAAIMGSVLELRYQASSLQREVAIFADMRGPEFRVRADPKDTLLLEQGDRIRFTTREGNTFKEDDTATIHFKSPRDYDLIRDLQNNRETFGEGKPVIYIDDGKINITLENWPDAFDSEHPTTDFFGVVLYGGMVKHNKSMNLPGFKLRNLPGLTQADQEIVTSIFNVAFVEGAWQAYAKGKPKIKKMVTEASEKGAFHLLGFDYVAPSFVRSVDDLIEFEHLLKRIGARHIQLIPKIETREAVKPEVLAALLLHPLTIGAMVARGDLAVEAGFQLVPSLQNRIHGTARDTERFSILSTDVLGSMTDGAPQAKRGEYGDLFRSLQEGTHSVMLSNETADGSNPVYVVKHLLETMSGAGMEPTIATSRVRHDQQRYALEMRDRAFQEMRLSDANADELEQVDLYDDLMRTVLRLPENPFVDGLVLWSERGKSMRAVAQVLPSLPVYLVTDQARVAREGAISRGIFPILVKEKPQSGKKLMEIARSAIAVSPHKDVSRLKVIHNLESLKT